MTAVASAAGSAARRPAAQRGQRRAAQQAPGEPDDTRVEGPVALVGQDQEAAESPAGGKRARPRQAAKTAKRLAAGTAERLAAEPEAEDAGPAAGRGGRKSRKETARDAGDSEPAVVSGSIAGANGAGLVEARMLREAPEAELGELVDPTGPDGADDLGGGDLDDVADPADADMAVLFAGSIYDEHPWIEMLVSPRDQTETVIAA